MNSPLRHRALYMHPFLCTPSLYPSSSDRHPLLFLTFRLLINFLRPILHKVNVGASQSLLFTEKRVQAARSKVDATLTKQKFLEKISNPRLLKNSAPYQMNLELPKSLHLQPSTIGSIYLSFPSFTVFSLKPLSASPNLLIYSLPPSWM